MKGAKPKTCQNCNVDFTCYNSGCWCNNLPQIIPLDPNRNCYCVDCLKVEVQKKIKEYTNNLTPENLKQIRDLGKVEKCVEGIDYYINDDGLHTFTKWYHLRRGYCCENNCKHCPYPKLEK